MSSKCAYRKISVAYIKQREGEKHDSNESVLKSPNSTKKSKQVSNLANRPCEKASLYIIFTALTFSRRPTLTNEYETMAPVG